VSVVSVVAAAGGGSGGTASYSSVVSRPVRRTDNPCRLWASSPRRKPNGRRHRCRRPLWPTSPGRA